MACSARLVDSFGDSSRGIQPFNAGARQHDRREQAVIQQEDVLHHLVLMLLNQSGIHALLQTGGNFLFCHGPAGTVVNPKQFENGMGAEGQQPDKRLGPRSDPHHGTRHQARHGLGVKLTDALGHQFAEHNGDVGNGHHHNGRGRNVSRPRRNPQALQPHRQLAAEGRLANDAVQHTDGRDADLHRR